MKGFHNDTHALASVKAQIEFVLAHVDTLRRNDRSGRLEEAVREGALDVRAGRLPQTWVMTKIETAYERVMALLYDEEPVKTKVDRKRKGLRFG